MPSIDLRTTSSHIQARAEKSLRLGAYVGGLSVAGVVVIALLSWITARYFRNRTPTTSPPIHRTASVRSLVRDASLDKQLPETPHGTPKMSETHEKPPQSFLPALPTLPDIPTAEDIINFHKEAGNFPRPFSFALHAASRPSSLLSPPGNKHSSSLSPLANNRFSVLSTCSTVSTVQALLGKVRKVRQVFTPVLPDELLLTHIGEQLTILQSFDDGWCIAGRDNPAFLAAAGPQTLFPSAKEKESDLNMELGVVPAWTFVKPAKGVRPERPVRSSSLGITIRMETSSSRDSVISWSNF